MINHEHDDGGPQIVYDDRLFFRAVSTKDSDHFYQIRNGEIKKENGLNKVYTVEAMMEEFELSGRGGMTWSCTCSICGSSAAAISYWRSLFVEN